MRILIDLDTLSNGYIPLLSWLARMRGKIENTDEYLSVFPYNAMAIHLLNNDYKDEEIYIYISQKNELYQKLGSIVLDDLKENGFKCFIIDNPLTENYIYIGSNILNFNLFKNSIRSNFIGDIFQYIFSILIYGSSNNYLSFFRGFFTVFFTDLFSSLFWSILMIWPMLFEVHNIDLNRMIVIFFIGFFMIKLSSLTRTLLELNNERIAFKENKELLCGSTFITGTSSVFIGIFWSIIYFISILILSMYSPIAFLYGLVIFLLNFVLYLSPTNLRIIFFISAMFLIQLVINPTFALKFIRLQ